MVDDRIPPGTPFALDGHHLVLPPGGAAHTAAAGEAFWATVDQREDLVGGRLVGVFDYPGDWDTWEAHPAGEELVAVLDGTVELLLDEPSGVRSVVLDAGRAVLVPPGTWHTARVSTPSRALHITPGDGTTHRHLADGPPLPAAV